MCKQLLLLAAMLAVYACSNPFSSNDRPEPGTIIFAANLNGEMTQIYAMQEDGSNIMQLTHSDFVNYAPRWSHDGRFIIYNSEDRGGNLHFQPVVMADKYGDNERVLLEHGYGPLFSPSNNTIAFSLDWLLPGFGGPTDIAFYDLKHDTGWLFDEDTTFFEDVEDWSPDGRFLLSARVRTGAGPLQNIFLIDLRDSSRTQLTNDNNSRDGRFSPDGSQIVYTVIGYHQQNKFISRLYVMDRNGANKREVLQNERNVFFAAWSSNGSMLIYSGEDDELSPNGKTKYNFYSVNLDGSDEKRLTDFGDAVEIQGLDCSRMISP